MLSAAASLGWLYLWDVDDSINHIDPLVYADDVNIQVSHSVTMLTLGRGPPSHGNDQLDSPQ